MTANFYRADDGTVLGAEAGSPLDSELQRKHWELIDEPTGNGGEPEPSLVIEVNGEMIDLAAIDDDSRLREIAASVGANLGNAKKAAVLRERIAGHVSEVSNA